MVVRSVRQSVSEEGFFDKCLEPEVVENVILGTRDDLVSFY